MKKKKSATNLFAKECISTALLLLLKEKEFDSISITDIAKKAGVSRNTYYRNYNSKEDIILDYIKGLNNQLYEKLNRIDFHNNTKEFFFEILLHFKKHRDFLNFIYNSELAYLMNNLIQQTVTEISTKLGPKEKYKFLFFAGSISFIAEGWLFSGEQENIEEMSTIMCELFHSQPPNFQEAS